MVLAVRTVGEGRAGARRDPRRVPTARLEVRRVDLADLASIREFADGLLADGTPVDMLLNNAGVMAPPRRMTTADGFELQFGSNFLGPFALTMRLLPLLLAAPAPRVVTMSSLAALGRIHFDDLQWEQRYSPWGTYAQSKLADLMFARQLATVADERGWALRSTPRTRATPGPTCRTRARAWAARVRRCSRGARTPCRCPRSSHPRAPSPCCSPPPTRPPRTAATTARAAASS